MGHTNSTANLSLPQFIGTDKPTWLGDINGAFSAIDSYAGTNDAAVAAAVSDASSAISQASAAVNTANTANTTAGNASTAANNAVGVANTANAIAGTVDAKVGLLADLNTTDRTSIVNAINEVDGLLPGKAGSVTVTGDGVMTYSQAMDALYALIDQSKIRPASYFVYDNNAICPITNLTSNALVFSSNVSAARAQMFTLKSSTSTWFTYNFAASSYSDESAGIIPSGRTLAIFY